MQMFFNYLTPMTIKDCGKPYDPVSNGFTAEASDSLQVFLFTFSADGRLISESVRVGEVTAQ